MPMVSLMDIVPGPNARDLPPAPGADERMRQSVATIGVLQPILLRSRENKLEVVIGGRRYRAAIAAGLTDIPAEVREMTDAEVEAAQLAENIQREPMHPVDTWRGINALIQSHAVTFEQAAAALGLDERGVRRMEMLSRLDPHLLALCEVEMPKPEQLRVIAAAPAKLQASVAKGKDLRDNDGGVNWYDIASRCRVVRISRAHAIFDTAAAKGPAWDEDLFAEPGADDQFTTANVARFMECQEKALTEKVAELAKAKKRHQVAKMASNGWSVALPSGFLQTYSDNPDRLKRHETAFHAVRPDGQIAVVIALDTKAAKAADAAKPKKATTAVADDDPDVDPGDDDDDTGIEGAPEPEVKPPFSKAGMAMIRAAKTAALRKQLDDTPMEAPEVLALLVLALCGENVSARGAHGGFKDLAARMLAPGGNRLQLSEADLCTIGQTAVGRILDCGEVTGRFTSLGSGDAAEWVGAAINAADALPRFDTEEFLATATNAELKRAAAGAGLLSGGTGTQLRERLAGRAPKWRPEAAVFGAPAPRVRMRTDD
jgi:ParB family chromosome partitioning protein